MFCDRQRQYGCCQPQQSEKSNAIFSHFLTGLSHFHCLSACARGCAFAQAQDVCAITKSIPHFHVINDAMRQLFISNKEWATVMGSSRGSNAFLSTAETDRELLYATGASASPPDSRCLSSANYLQLCPGLNFGPVRFRSTNSKMSQILLLSRYLTRAWIHL